MTKGKAIKLFCRDCAGGTAKEVTLCGIADCPLWEHRLGCSPRTRQYQTRVAGALRAHPGLVKELREAGVDMAVFSCEHARNGLPGENSTRSRVRAGLGSLSKTPSNKSALSPAGTSSGG